MNTRSSLEMLEARIAPAALATLTIVGKKATYTDADGDLVTIAFTGGTAPLTTSLFSGVAGAHGDQLQTINLSAGGFAGADITISVKRVSGGDGLANIGYIDSIGHDLGKVSIQGDLGQIDAGDSLTTAASPAIVALKVHSFGHRGTATQDSANPHFGLESDLIGGLGALTVTNDFQGAFLKVTGAVTGTDDAGGAIGPIVIGGSLIGGMADDSGEILASGKIGAVSIAEDIRGGSGARSGLLQSGSDMGSVTLGGSLLGGFLASSNAGSGEILAFGNLGKLKIAHDVVFGSGSHSGYIQAGDLSIAENPVGKIASVTIGGSLIGNATTGGTVESANSIGPVKIGESIVGGLINSVTTIGTVSIGGSLLPGSTTSSGVVSSGGNMGLVTIGHDIEGTSVLFSGLIYSGGNLAGVQVGGSILGGAANLAVSVTLTGGIYATGDLGPVKVMHNLVGGKNGTTTTTINSTNYSPHDLSDSGVIEAGGRIASVTILGSIVAGGVFGTGTIERSGAIVAGHDLGSLTVDGSLLGDYGSGTANTPVFIGATGQANPAAGTDLAIGKISIGHRVEDTQIVAGFNFDSSLENADAQIGPVTVGGSWVASSLVAGAQNFGADHVAGDGDDNLSFGNADDALFTGHDTATLSKIVSLTIKGTLSGTLNSLSATDHFGFVAQSFGAVKINGAVVATPSSAPALLDLGDTGDVSLHRLGS